MSTWLSQVKFDLTQADKSDQAYSRLLKVSKELRALPERMRQEPVVVQLSILLQGIPPGEDCECCGYRGLTHVCRVQGHVVGPECAGHPLGSCKGRAKGLTA